MEKNENLVIIAAPHTSNWDGVFGFAAIHSTGSGKTMTSLVAAECYLQKHPEGRVIIVAKTSLLDHFWREFLEVLKIFCLQNYRYKHKGVCLNISHQSASVQ